MKAESTEMAAHAAQELTQFALALKLTRVDATVFAYTTHDEDATIGGVLYKSSPGFTASALRVPSDLSVANFEVIGAIDDEDITEADLLAGRFDFAAVEMIQYVWSDLTITPKKVFKGKIGDVPKASNKFQTTLVGLADALQDPVGKIVQPICRHDFGDVNCGADLSALEQTGTITSVASRRAFQASGLTGAGPRTTSYTANTISFATLSSGPPGNGIFDSANGFITAGFLVGDSISISGSDNNDLTHNIAALAAGRITTESATVVKEPAGPEITIVAQTMGYFDGGRVTWLTGANAGLSMEVKTWDGTDALVLFLPEPYDIEDGDTFTIVPGCDKRIPTCVAFGLILNFGGEATVPGVNGALVYPDGQ